MTFWISARTADDRATEHLTRFVEANSFEGAVSILHQEACVRWGERRYRVTSVTEQPREAHGPVALLIDLASAHRAVETQRIGGGR